MALSNDNITKFLFKKFMGVSSTDPNRQFFEEPYVGRNAILGIDIWSQSDSIPTTASPSLINDNDIDGIVQLKKDVSMSLVPGTTNSFYSVELVDAIPFNFGDGSYNYVLKDSTNQNIPFGLGDWVVDPTTGTLTFYGILPSNMPPKITFYKYIGAKGVIGGEVSLNVNVNATGTDTYIGTSVEGITSYETNTIYIVSFQNDNTGASTIDIDGVGVLDIVKGDETGLVPLEAGDIQNTVLYYMLYDGGQFQIFTENPDSIPNTYTNLNPVPLTLGGVLAGTTFNNTPISGVFDMLFYPYIASQFSTFSISGQATILEVGQSIVAGNKTFVWSTSNPGGVAVNTVKIKQVTAPASTLASGLANDGNQVINFASPITKSVATSHTWRIEATRTNSSTMFKNYSVSWRWRIFYGNNANTVLTEADIEALSNTNLDTTFTGSYTFAGGNYKYFAFPSAFGAVNLFKDADTQLAVSMAGIAEGYTSTNGNGLYYQIVSVTNAYGITHNYFVYRTRNILNGNINISVT